jgi:hypothetical protein
MEAAQILSFFCMETKEVTGICYLHMHNHIPRFRFINANLSFDDSETRRHRWQNDRFAAIRSVSHTSQNV